MEIYRRLADSRAVQSGLLQDLAESELFVEGVGMDKVSDLTSNIIRGPLALYTKTQCDLLGIPVAQSPLPAAWDPTQREWRQDYHSLPRVEDRPILFVPKGYVRYKLAFLSDEYYDRYVIEYLRDEAFTAHPNLVRTLKSGERRITKQSIKELYPKDKAWLMEFSRSHPDVWENYRATRKSDALSNDQLDGQYDGVALAASLRDQLQRIPPGNANADAFHSLMLAILEFIFYPELQHPRREWEIHEGRKRIDVLCDNTSAGGFFARQLHDPSVGARTVIVECKNYSRDIANPELDQLAGRFGPQRGRLGFIVARSFDQRALFIKRCQDTAEDNRGYVIPVCDSDIEHWLAAAGEGRWRDIDDDLTRRFSEIVSG